MSKRGAGPIRRVDANQPEIVAALREFGFSVLPISQIGKGAPDLIVGGPSGGGWVDRLVEVKAPGGKLTADEAEFHQGWKGAPVIVAYSADDVLRAFGWEVA